MKMQAIFSFVALYVNPSIVMHCRSLLWSVRQLNMMQGYTCRCRNGPPWSPPQGDGFSKQCVSPSVEHGSMPLFSDEAETGACRHSKKHVKACGKRSALWASSSEEIGHPNPVILRFIARHSGKSLQAMIAS